MRLIDVDALRKRFSEECPGDCSSCDYCCATNGKLFCSLIDDAPTVDVPILHIDAIPVRGEWDYSGNVPDNDNNIQCRCTNCGAGDQHAVSMMHKVPFCWQCGAKMDLEVQHDHTGSHPSA